MVRGGPSLNPHGRPRTGTSLAEAMRKRFPVEDIVELAAKLATCDDAKVRMSALQFIADRAHGKVINATDVTLNDGRTGARIDWSTVPIERRRLLMNALTEVDQITAAAEGDDVLEGEAGPDVASS